MPGPRGFPEVIGNIEILIAGGTDRHLKKLHMGLFRGPPGFSPVAGCAGAHQIFPGMLSALMSGHHMVQGQLMALFTAILAGKMVAVEDFYARQFGLGSRSPDQTCQANNRGQRVRKPGSMDISGPIFQHLRLTAEN